jgi:hypothetical protein
MRPAAPPLAIHRFTVSDFHRMREVGVLSQGAKVELLDGHLVDMPRPSARELEVTAQLVEILAEGLEAAVVPGRPAHPEAYATFDAALMVHDWKQLPSTAPCALHRFSVEEYRRLMDTAILPPGRRFELLDGVVFEADRRRHQTRAESLARLLRASHCGPVIKFGDVVRLGPYSLLTLDVAICHDRPDGYESAPPAGADVRVVIDDSARRPEVVPVLRWPLYARWGVEVAWVVDTSRQEILVGRAPSAARFKDVRVFHPRDALTVGPDSRIDVADLLRPGGS